MSLFCWILDGLGYLFLCFIAKNFEQQFFFQSLRENCFAVCFAETNFLFFTEVKNARFSMLTNVYETFSCLSGGSVLCLFKSAVTFQVVCVV